MKKNDKEAKIYTISLVKNNQLHKLPNVNVSTIKELEEFYKQNRSNYQFQEVWYCKKQTKKREAFSIGRISISTLDQISNIEQGQIVEQVWNTNHKTLEKYIEGEAISYLRASRTDWGRRYSIDKVKVSMTEDISKAQMITEFIESVKEIELSKEKIERMSQYLKELGINEYSIEYLLEGSRFSFIDWDSQDDLRVIEALIKEKKICEGELEK